MDLRERFEDAQEALRAAIHGALINVWTALPGIVQSFDAHALTVTVRPAIQGVVRRRRGAGRRPVGGVGGAGGGAAGRGSGRGGGRGGRPPPLYVREGSARGP